LIEVLASPKQKDCFYTIKKMPKVTATVTKITPRRINASFHTVHNKTI